MDRKLWEPKENEPDRIYRMDAGERSVFGCYTNGEWRIASSLDRGRTRQAGWEEIGSLSGPGGEQAGYGWTRILSPASKPVIRAVPAMPDKPLVIRPLNPIFLPEGEEGRFFVEIPLWIRITGGGEGAGAGEVLLTEVSTKEMSKTWFGNFSAGELCYVSRFGAWSEETTAIAPAAVCPVRVENSTGALLEVGRFLLRTEFLAVFEGKDRLWTSSVDLIYRGREEASQATGTEAPEQLEGEGKLLTPSRAVPDNSIVRKSFSLLKDLTGW
jgi:hypothetical protein